MFPRKFVKSTPFEMLFSALFFQHHEVFLQNSTSCRLKAADKMKLEFERLCLRCTPPFDCSILCRVSLHLVCAKFFQGLPPIAKFRQANFRPRDLLSMISFLLSEILRIFCGNFVLHGRIPRPFRRNIVFRRCEMSVIFREKKTRISANFVCISFSQSCTPPPLPFCSVTSNGWFSTLTETRKNRADSILSNSVAAAN